MATYLDVLPADSEGAADWFSGDANPGTADGDLSITTAAQPASPSFAVPQSWSFADDGDADPALDTDVVYESAPEKSAEPHSFQINDRLKLKAQPLGGGLGGRVTLTFSFDTGY